MASEKMEAVFEALFEALDTAADFQLEELRLAVEDYRRSYARTWSSIVGKQPVAKGLLDAIDEAARKRLKMSGHTTEEG